MTEYNYELKIPMDRIAVLIGKNGEIKKYIEEETKTKLKIDSDEGDVFVSGEDALGLFNAREVIRAVGRGFNPDVAQVLLKGDYIFETINIMDFSGKSKDNMLRLKGRVIGSEGKSRRTIENLSDTRISVYGKTIAIIGQPENVGAAKRAIESLLTGSQHANVYKWLEKNRRELKRKEFVGEDKSLFKEFKEKSK